MRLRLKYKFFMVLLAASILIIACMFLFTRFSFEQGFLSYVDQMEMRRLGKMCRILEEAYGNEGGWQFLKENPEEWYRLQDYPFMKWRHKHDSPGRPNRREDRPGQSSGGDDHYGGGRKNVHMHRRSPCRPDKCPDVVLLDKDKKPILGEKNDSVPKARLIPITVGDQTVGWLGMIPPKSIIEADELNFLKKQSRMLLFIAIAMALLSVIVALLTAYYLEGPVSDLTKGTKALASGKYDVRIPVKSEDELGQLSRHFNILARTLEENEKGRKQWVADIAHELRTPLTLLSGELQAIQDGVRELTPETLSLLNDDIAHLIRLVNDLNELSKTDLGALSYKKKDIDLVKVLEKTVDRFQGEIQAAGLDLECDIGDTTPIWIFADPERISQLFGNILQNSLSYTHEKGRIKVWIDRMKQKVVVNIQDSEPGVTEEAIPKLFDRLFRQESTRNRDQGGTGLGLSICKNIIDAHEGKISATPSPIGGLWIQVEFPVSP